jgi:hypothetical protein
MYPIWFARSLLFTHVLARLSYDYFLKIEDVNAWYAPLVRTLNLQSAAASGWEPTTKFWSGITGGCFYRAPDVGCDSMLTEGNSTRADRIVGWSSANTAGRQRNRHAESKLQEFYTPALTSIVTAWVKRDIELFGYAQYSPKETRSTTGVGSAPAASTGALSTLSTGGNATKHGKAPWWKSHQKRTKKAATGR